jgi:hypothetical protein
VSRREESTATTETTIHCQVAANPTYSSIRSLPAWMGWAGSGCGQERAETSISREIHKWPSFGGISRLDTSEKDEADVVNGVCVYSLTSLDRTFPKSSANVFCPLFFSRTSVSSFAYF